MRERRVRSVLRGESRLLQHPGCPKLHPGCERSVIEQELAAVEDGPEGVFQDRLRILLGGEDFVEGGVFLRGGLADEATEVDLFDHLLRHAPARREEIPLPEGSPYGRVQVDRQKCTMCLACVGACPEGALIDAKDKPQLRFIERNCVQCGLCEKTCPEDAISLAARLLLRAEATQPVVLNEDQVFACVRCGKPFANQRIIDSMLGRLTSHSMFKDPAALRRLATSR